ncbi:MAG: hypothetical protein AAF939_01315 [Planctomycetota bacterium]
MRAAKQFVVLCGNAADVPLARLWFEWLTKNEPDVTACFTCDLVVSEADYVRAVSFIEEHLAVAEASNLQLTILLGPLNPSGLSATTLSNTFEAVVARLILTFPEVEWHFPSCDDQAEEPIDGHHSLLGSWMPSICPLFDGSGLRDSIREKTTCELKLDTESRLAVRIRKAAVIEDEADYAMLHGYGAYRYGYRVEIVTSFDRMKKVFGPDSESEKDGSTPSHDFDLIFEDMRLQFPDKPANVKLSDLKERARIFPKLSLENDSSKFRFLITTGQENPDTDLVSENEKFLDKKTRRVHGLGDLLRKPVGGPISLWKKSELKEHLGKDERCKGQPRGNAPGFQWPPIKNDSDPDGGHGAPGKLAMVARMMVDRARRHCDGAKTASDWIRIAVLAGDALELLQCKTPSLAIDALRLKHVAEVQAECTFVGTGFHCDVNDRIVELDAEIAAVCRWYDDESRKTCVLDAKTSILNDLIHVYRNHGRMEEEDQCLDKFRLANRALQRRHETNPLMLVFHALLGYSEYLMGGFHRIFIAFVAWVAFFTLISFATTSTHDDHQLPIYVAKQLNWMVGGGTHDVSVDLDKAKQSSSLTGTAPNTTEATANESDKKNQTKQDKEPTGELKSKVSPADSVLVCISICANVIGVLHFVILSSFFYSLISRK